MDNNYDDTTTETYSYSEEGNNNDDFRFSDVADANKAMSYSEQESSYPLDFSSLQWKMVENPDSLQNYKVYKIRDKDGNIYFGTLEKKEDYLNNDTMLHFCNVKQMQDVADIALKLNEDIDTLEEGMAAYGGKRKRRRTTRKHRRYYGRRMTKKRRTRRRR